MPTGLGRNHEMEPNMTEKKRRLLVERDRPSWIDKTLLGSELIHSTTKPPSGGGLMKIFEALFPL